MHACLLDSVAYLLLGVVSNGQLYYGGKVISFYLYLCVYAYVNIYVCGPRKAEEGTGVGFIGRCELGGKPRSSDNH